MKKILFILALLPLAMSAQYHGMTAVDIGSGIKMLVMKPHGDTTGKRYPLIIFLNGNGEIGTNYATLFNAGLARNYAIDSANMRNKFDSMYVISVLPQTNALAMEQPNNLFRVMDWAKSTLTRSDTTNWMLAGLSQGAINTIDAPGWPYPPDAGLASFGDGSNYRFNRFRKFVAISTCSNRDGTVFSRFAGKGFRIAHGTSDGTCSSAWSGILYNNLIAAGAYGSQRYIAGGGHDNGVWDQVLSTSGIDTTNNIFLWLLAGNSGNINPTANAGSNQTLLLPTTTGVLNGSASTDADGTISTYAWTKTSGPGTYTIVNPAIASTTVTGLVTGTYIFTLTVTDNAGGTNSASVTIVVKANGTKYIYPIHSGSIIITKNSTTPALGGKDTLVVTGTFTNVQIQDIQGTEILIDGYGSTVANASFQQPSWYDLDGVTVAGFNYLNYYGTIRVEKNVYNSKLKYIKFINTGTYRNQPILQWDKGFSTDMVFTGNKFQTFYNDTIENCTFNGFQDVSPAIFGTNWNTSNNEINRSIMLDLVMRYDTFKNITNTNSGFNVIFGTGFGLKFYGNYIDSISANVGAYQHNHAAGLLWYGTLDAHDNIFSNAYAGSIRNYTLRWTGLPEYTNGRSRIWNNRDRHALSYSRYEFSGTGAGNRDAAHGFLPTGGDCVYNTIDSTTGVTYNPAGSGTVPWNGRVIDLVNMDSSVLIEGNVIFRPEMEEATSNFATDSAANNGYFYAAVGSAPTNLTIRNNYSARYSTGKVVDSISYKPAANSPMTGSVNLISYALVDHFGVTRTSGNVAKGWSVYNATAAPPGCAVNTSPANGSTVAGQTSATVVWGAVATATSYDVYRNGAFISNTVSATYNFTGLVASNNYTWYVTPKNASGSAVGCGSSSVSSFTTAAIPVPSCVTNLLPVNGSTVSTTTSATLQWTAASGATSYSVYVFLNGFSAPATPTYTISGTSVVAGALFPDISYRFFVVPNNSSGSATGCSSNYTIFTTSAIPIPYKKWVIIRK